MDTDYAYHMPVMNVKSLENIPKGLDYFTFLSSLCARLCFLGPSVMELNVSVADGLFKAIDDFINDDSQKYFLERKRLIFERFDLAVYDGNFSVMTLSNTGLAFLCLKIPLFLKIVK